MEGSFLVVGLGNPGRTYDDTRHNIGFRVVTALGAKYGITFRPALVRAKGSLGEGIIAEKKTKILKPLTYMNESGSAVRKCASFYKIGPDHLMVITDDVALPFGQIRLRSKGGSGGHNGLKSVEAHLGSQEYPRLRIGVGDTSDGELSDYVLGRFTQKEQQMLPDVVDEAIEAVELWLSSGIETAMQEVNRSK